MSNSKCYAQRDRIALGEYYTRHVSAMTAENLHAKSAIAAELAWRDREIDRLKSESIVPSEDRHRMTMAEFLRQDPEVLRPIYEQAIRQANIEQQKVIDEAKQPKKTTPYAVTPTTRAKMEEWLKEGTLIDRVAEVLTQQENEIIRLEKLVNEQSAPYDYGPQAATIEEATRDVGKWLNERPNRPLDLRHVAMLVHHAQAAPPQDAESINKDLLHRLIDCVEDSEECLQRHLESYGETYKPQRVAAMRKCIADARAAIDSARAQQEDKP